MLIFVRFFRYGLGAIALLTLITGCIVPPAPQADPGAVTGMSPGNEATVFDANPILSWTPVPGATRYEVKMAETRAGLDAAKPIETGTAYHTPKGGLETGKTYYWRVRALNGSGRAGKWSPDRSLRISTITGMQPSDGAATFNPTPTLSWTAAAGISRYEVQIAERPGFRDAVRVKAETNRFTPQTPLAGNKTYYWRVRTAEADDRTGRWSTIFSLSLDTGAVTGMAPPSGAATTDTTPTLSWTAPVGAARYEVQIADTSAGLSSATVKTATAARYTPSPALALKTHYWRVRAVAGDGTTGSWSRPFALTVSWAAITGMSPASGTETSDTAPTLSWTPIPGASRYEVQIADTTAGMARAAAKTVRTPSYTPDPALPSGRTHYWRVRPLDSAGTAGAWSQTFGLTVSWGGITGMSPADGDAVTGTTPNLTWTAVTGATSYQVQIADSARGLAAADPKLVQGASYTPSTALAGGKTHYWRVRALGSGGRTGKWSRTFALQVSWAVITGLSPVSGTLSTDTTPTLSWTPVSGASSYEVQLAATPAEVPNASAKTVQTARYTPGAALAFQIHYWRVRALNSAGNASAWSQVYSLQVYWGAVTGMSPASGETTTDTTPALSWTAVSGASRYEVQTAASVDFVNPKTASARDNSYTPTAALTNGQTHYWRVRAVNAKNQTGAWSAASSLHVNWGTVTGMAPASGSATTDTTPTLNWTSVAGASRYDVQIAGTSAGLTSATATPTAAARYTPSPALALKTHYWRVRALTADGTTGSWSSPFVLTVSWAAITGMNPASGTETSDTTPTLSWTPVLGASRYQVRIADASAGLDGASPAEVTAASYTPGTALPPKTHYWRVRALDSSGNAGAWSRTQSLTVNWGGITGMSPATGSTTSDTTPTLSWGAVTGATRYRVQIADTAIGVVSAAETTTGGTSHTPSTALTNAKTHYWRVRALDSSGNAGAWSRTFRLRVNWGVITGMSPATGSTTPDTTPTLRWAPVTGAAGYTVQIADTAAGVASATETTANSASYTPSTPLTNAETHYWRVRATDGDGQTGAWSGTYDLEVNWGVIIGMEPPSGSGTTDTTPTLDWQTVTGAASYKVQITDTAEGAANATERTVRGTRYTPMVALAADKTHYWRVRAIGSDGTEGAWSTVSALHVSWAVISGMSPGDGAVTTDATPTLRWSTVPGATGYEVRIAETEAGLESAGSKTTTAATYTPGTALAYFKMHYWRVRPLKDGTPAGAWSPTFSLKVDDGFILVSGGTFRMGTRTGGLSRERPVHSVTLSDFLMSRYEVTQEGHNAVMGTNPSYFKTGPDAGKRPVEQVTWYDAVKYCNALSRKRALEEVYTIGTGTTPTVTADWSKNGYRLPTEAGWEYAARGGSKNRGYTYSGSKTVGEVAWYKSNSGTTTHPAGDKAANELGLHDMSGNVWEWVWDRYGAYTSAAETDPRGPGSGANRVARGGSWSDYAEVVRSAERGKSSPDFRRGSLGFRVCRTAD